MCQRILSSSSIRKYHLCAIVFIDNLFITYFYERNKKKSIDQYGMA